MGPVYMMALLLPDWNLLVGWILLIAFFIAQTSSGEAANGIYVQHYGTGGEDGHSKGQVFWTGIGISQGFAGQLADMLSIW